MNNILTLANDLSYEQVKELIASLSELLKHKREICIRDALITGFPPFFVCEKYKISMTELHRIQKKYAIPYVPVDERKKRLRESKEERERMNKMIKEVRKM